MNSAHSRKRRSHGLEKIERRSENQTQKENRAACGKATTDKSRKKKVGAGKIQGAETEGTREIARYHATEHRGPNHERWARTAIGVGGRERCAVFLSEGRHPRLHHR